jgi:BRCT domain type II-containing protein
MTTMETMETQATRKETRMASQFARSTSPPRIRIDRHSETECEVMACRAQRTDTIRVQVFSAAAVEVRTCPYHADRIRSGLPVVGA